MGTKLKNYNKGIFYGGSVICIVATCILAMISMWLMMSYQIGSAIEGGLYNWEGKEMQDNALTAISEQVNSNTSLLWIIGIVCFIIIVASLIYLLIAVGDRDENGNYKLNWFDKIFTDLQLILGFFAGFAVFGLEVLWYEYNISSNALLKVILGVEYSDIGDKALISQYKAVFGYDSEFNGFTPQWVEAVLLAASALVCIGVCLACILSVIKKIKAGAFWKKTIIGTFWCYIYDSAKRSDDIFWKVMVVAIVACLVSATWVGTVLVLALIFIFLPKWLKKYQAVKDGINEVKSGNLNYKIPVTDNGELDRLALSINQISAATNIAVQNELKNQRLKTDLISNVSHDLKTPLTSMVSYVDLLKTEGLTSENAPEYLKIIDEKTRRLQKLTEDLFEAAKASSGAMPVSLERIDMTSIVNQALGELDEKLAANDLQVIFAQKTESTFVMADGQLLWRVIENLLVNASKYALTGSRVYMDIVAKGDNSLQLEIKNISKDQLNISADELMERFNRGDQSRNTEGSGLGLSIAKDLTKLMNGSFEVFIDGDLFKASIALNRAEGPEKTSVEEQ